MMRERLANNSKHATMLLTGTSVPIMSSALHRTGSFPLSAPWELLSVSPYWLRLYRAGSTITGYVSADGVNWSSDHVLSEPAQQSTLPRALQHNFRRTQGQATFDHITINGGAARLGRKMPLETELTLKAYPNPFSEDLFIAVENALPSEVYQVRLSNMLGPASLRL